MVSLYETSRMVSLYETSRMVSLYETSRLTWKKRCAHFEDFHVPFVEENAVDE